MCIIQGTDGCFPGLLVVRATGDSLAGLLNKKPSSPGGEFLGSAIKDAPSAGQVLRNEAADIRCLQIPVVIISVCRAAAGAGSSVAAV